MHELARDLSGQLDSKIRILEMLIREALGNGKRKQAQISVKFGALRDPDKGWLGYDGRPVAVRNFLAYSLKRLGVDHIDIYRPARLDPSVPVEETVGAIADMVKAGQSIDHLVPAAVAEAIRGSSIYG